MQKFTPLFAMFKHRISSIKNKPNSIKKLSATLALSGFGGLAFAACPNGASFDSALGFCSDGTNAYGPFTQAMTDKCTAYGGGPACTTTNPYPVAGVNLSLQRWSYNFAKSIRGTATCPVGSAVDSAVDNQCVETVAGTKNVYAGFLADVVSRCTTLGGGNACLSTRWNANFYMKASFQHRLQNNLTAVWYRSGIPSISVSVSTPDQGNVVASTGVAAPTSNPVDPALSQYRFASVTKNLTTAIIMRLQEVGRLNIDNPLSMYLTVPGLAYQNTMTIRQLLNHSAGVGDYLDNSGSFLSSTNYWKIYTNNDIVGYINEVGPAFSPGAAYQYSNGGFFVLGLVVEKILGAPIETAFEQWITTPLQLKNSFLDVTSTPTMRIPNLVESSRPYAYSTTSVKSAGALVATTADMAKYARAVYSGGLLSASSMNAMKAPSARNSNYGLGTIRFTAPDGVPYFGHTGTLLNYKSLIYYVPSMDVSVALTMNDYPNSTLLDNVKSTVYNTVKAQYQR